jgi:hypothetical protein
MSAIIKHMPHEAERERPLGSFPDPSRILLSRLLSAKG